MIFSTTVQDKDGDGLLDVWEQNKGYTDAIPNANGQHEWVALPDASADQRDIFVELDYLTNLDGAAGKYLHSHVPKQQALDMVGKALEMQGITVHFDLGPGVYSDKYVVSYPVDLSNMPAGAVPPPAGAGGNAISEGTLTA